MIRNDPTLEMPADENDKKLLEYVRGAEFAGFVNARAQVKEMIDSAANAVSGKRNVDESMKLNNVCIKMRFGSSTQNNKYIKMLDPSFLKPFIFFSGMDCRRGAATNVVLLLQNGAIVEVKTEMGFSLDN